MIHGGASAALGQSLGAVAQVAGGYQDQKNEQAKTDLQLATARQALAEHDQEWQARTQLAGAQAEIGKYDLGASGGVGPPAPGVGELPPGIQGPVIHPATGLPDYRDQATLQKRIEATRKVGESTITSPLARAEFYKEQGTFIQGHILDNQEAEAVDGIANMVHSMTLTAGVSKDPVMEALNQEALPRLQAIEQTIRSAKGVKDLALRHSIVQSALAQIPTVQAGIANGIKEAHEKTDAVGELQQYMDSLPLNDPGRAEAKAAQTGIAMGGSPKQIADKFAFTRRGYVQLPDGSYDTKENALIKIQQMRAHDAADQGQERNALMGAKQAETQRHDKAMESKPVRASAPVRPMTEGQIDDVARKYVNSTNKLDVNSSADDRSEWRMLFETKKKELRAQIGKAQSSPVPSQDLQSKFNAMSEADKAAYLQAAGIK